MLTSTILAVLSLSTVSLATTPDHDPLPADLQALIQQAHPPALHSALHSAHPSFRDGTHENDLAAIQAVHRESPSLASEILKLARRQNSNATTAGPATTPGDAHRSTALYLTTFTPPNGGAPTVITAFSVVGVEATGAAAVGSTGDSGSGGSRNGKGTLQNVGAGRADFSMVSLVMAGVVGAAMCGFVGML